MNWCGWVHRIIDSQQIRYHWSLRLADVFIVERAINRLNQAKLSWRISFTNADLSGITAALIEGLGVTVLATVSTYS